MCVLWVGAILQLGVSKAGLACAQGMVSSFDFRLGSFQLADLPSPFYTGARRTASRPKVEVLGSETWDCAK